MATRSSASVSIPASASASDIAVLGGGIAGAAACIALSRAGLRPLWIAPPGRDGDKPGEHLAPAARGVLDALGAADLLARPYHRAANVVFSTWGSERLVERHSMVHLEGPAIVLDRLRFEADLVERALQAGAERVAVAATSVSRQGGAWQVETQDAALRARFLLDATGRASVAGRLCASRVRADRLAAIVAFLEQPPAAEVEPTRATLIESGPDGWWYATLLPDGRLALNYYTDADLIPPGPDRPAVLQSLLRGTRYIGRWLEEADFRFVAPPRTTSAGTTWLAPAAGDDWAAVGDAAVAFDPLSSHGMTSALWTAASAAKAAVAALGGDAGALAEYARQVAEGVQSFLASQHEVYGREQRFGDKLFWQRRHGRPELVG